MDYDQLLEVNESNIGQLDTTTVQDMVWTLEHMFERYERTGEGISSKYAMRYRIALDELAKRK
jgi:hypothetical protein